jgi:hypothetical protein
MDRIDQLIETYRTQETARVFRKLDVLLDMEHLRDPRVVPFLLSVVQDPNEPIEVRSRIVRMLRAAQSCAAVAEPVARALCELLVDRTSPDLRVAAALTLAEFTAVRGIPAALGDIALDSAEPLDLRYCAFTSLERAGCTPDSAALLRRIALDDTLGPSARSLLARWQLP